MDFMKSMVKEISESMLTCNSYFISFGVGVLSHIVLPIRLFTIYIKALGDS